MAAGAVDDRSRELTGMRALRTTPHSGDFGDDGAGHVGGIPGETSPAFAVRADPHSQGVAAPTDTGNSSIELLDFEAWGSDGSCIVTEVDGLPDTRGPGTEATHRDPCRFRLASFHDRMRLSNRVPHRLSRRVDRNQLANFRTTVDQDGSVTCLLGDDVRLAF